MEANTRLGGEGGGRKQQSVQKKKVDSKPKLTEIEQLEENEIKACLLFKSQRILV